MQWEPPSLIRWIRMALNQCISFNRPVLLSHVFDLYNGKTMDNLNLHALQLSIENLKGPVIDKLYIIARAIVLKFTLLVGSSFVDMVK